MKKVGLALGSGGARGIAHIGVLKVLEANNIKIDYIAGTSIGAVIGAFYASGLSVLEIEKIALETDIFKIFTTLLDPSFKKGLVKGKKLEKLLESHLKCISFEDCKIPFAAVATDIHTGDKFKFLKGNLIKAIRASVSLPLIFKPLELDGKLLTDGGLSEPIPVQTIKDMGADIVIAVNLDTHTFEEEDTPNTYDIAYNSINILRHHLAKSICEQADVVLNIDLGMKDYWYKFDNVDKKIEAGAKCMQENLENLKSML